MLQPTILAVLVTILASGPSGAIQPVRPESLVGAVGGQLAIGRLSIGLTVPQAENILGHKLTLKPNVDDTGQCSGLSADVSIQGHRVALTFSARPSELRIQAMFVAFVNKPRDLDEVAAEIKRRVPELRMAVRDPLIPPGKSFWELPADPLQTVGIGVSEGIWVSRGCVNGVA